MDVPPDDIDTWLAAQAATEARQSGKPLAAKSPPPASPPDGDVQ